MWSLAPALAVVGVWRHGRARSPGIALVLVALVMVLTGIISIGGGFFFALTEGPLLLLTLVAARRATSRMG
jgi:hypothetical protein